MKTVIIDPSIATILQIAAINERERRPVIFTGAEVWPGTYNLKVWNSDKKNTEYTIPVEALEVVDEVMTWWIDPTAHNLIPRTYYAEIYSTEFKSIIYKATFEILA